MVLGDDAHGVATGGAKRETVRLILEDGLQNLQDDRLVIYNEQVLAPIFGQCPSEPPPYHTVPIRRPHEVDPAASRLGEHGAVRVAWQGKVAFDRIRTGA
ncbi:MAG: hypothetical protein Q8P18_11520 [Pseudomonadota bacterium]|nr:hypothetical protein [Pseudomonadota bacterium]